MRNRISGVAQEDIRCGQLVYLDPETGRVKVANGDDMTNEMPYSYGCKPEPKLEWKVEESNSSDSIYVRLLVDGTETPHTTVFSYGNSSVQKMAKKITKIKKRMLDRYRLCLQESGHANL